MENKLINLSLLNGTKPLSHKTKTNLDIYLKSKFPSGRATLSSEQSGGKKGELKTARDEINKINDIGELKDLLDSDLDRYKDLVVANKDIIRREILAKIEKMEKEKAIAKAEKENKFWKAMSTGSHAVIEDLAKKSDLEPLKKKMIK